MDILSTPGATVEPIRSTETLPSAEDGIGHPGHVPGYDPDAAILAARGVSSLAELNEKFRDGQRIKP